MALMDWFRKKKEKNSGDKENANPIINDFELVPRPSSPEMDKNRIYIKETLNYTSDLTEKPFTLADQTECVLFFLESLTDEEKLEKHFYSKLLHAFNLTEVERIVENMDAAKLLHVSESVSHILKGDSLLFINGLDYCYSIATAKIINREIGQPDNEQVVRGSHQGFVESIMVNIYLLRHMVTHPQFTVRYKEIGYEKNTRVAFAYINGKADNSVLGETERRLAKINTRKLISSAVVEEHLEDFPYSPFPQFMSTERPDRCALNLMDGKIILFVEGESTALILPVTFLSFYQSNDDYNSRWYAGTFFRLLRMFSFITSVTLPGIYIAIISFHYEIIPYGMTFVIKDAVEQIPYPPLIEAFFMELTLELIREAGVRLPSPIGQTIGIVGGLVIGDAVVNAGFVSSVMIIVVALTAISSFVVPANEMSMSIRLLRFPIMIMASLLGFLGIVFCLNLYLIHLCKLTSLGRPYFYPFAPFELKGILKEVIRVPHTKLQKYIESSQDQNNDGS